MPVIFRFSIAGRIPAGALSLVADAAKAGRIIAFPTDTVYGIGSTGLLKSASARLYAIKGRSAAKPLPVLVHCPAAARRWVQWSPAAETLAKKFWPGALTMVLNPTADGKVLTSADRPTVAIRVPQHAGLNEIIEASGVPWASTSANRSGEPALKDGVSVIKDFTGLADFILDGGPTSGAESTVVDLTGPAFKVLRPGAVSASDIALALEQPVP